MTLIFILCTFIIPLTLIYLLLNLRAMRHRGSPLPPGPKPWPILGNLPHLGTKPHQTMATLARTYGPLMHLRLGFVNVVVAASGSVAEQFLKTNDMNFASRPPNAGAQHVTYNYQDMVFAPYGPRWRLLRKISNIHLFSNKALDDFRYVRQEEIAVLVRSLASAGETAVNLNQQLNLCITNALGRVMLGKTVFGGEADSKAEEFRAMVVEMMILGGVFNISDFIPLLSCLDLQGLVKKTKKVHARFDSFLESILEQHKKQSREGSDQHMDFLSRLIALKDNVDGQGEKISDTEIKAVLVNMFTAGTDTSSSTIEWGLAELIRHPQILAQAQRELDNVVGRERLVTESDLSKLTYFQAIIKETFRLHPSTPLSVPRIASEKCEINGYLIPKSSTLLVNVWAIGRDPNVWDEPLEFQPERFLPGGKNANIDIRGNDFEVIPFGAGRRICPGISLGIRMVQLVTATLIHSFDWELAYGESPDKLNMEEGYGLTLQRDKPLTVHPRPRLIPSVYECEAEA